MVLASGRRLRGGRGHGAARLGQLLGHLGADVGGGVRRAALPDLDRPAGRVPGPRRACAAAAEAALDPPAVCPVEWLRWMAAKRPAGDQHHRGGRDERLGEPGLGQPAEHAGALVRAASSGRTVPGCSRFGRAVRADAAEPASARLTRLRPERRPAGRPHRRASARASGARRSQAPTSTWSPSAERQAGQPARCSCRGAVPARRLVLLVGIAVGAGLGGQVVELLGRQVGPSVGPR